MEQQLARPRVGDTVRAAWTVGSATQGSGWVPADRLTSDEDEWEVVEVHPSSLTVRKPASVPATIHDGQYLPGRTRTLPTGEPCSDAASYGRPEWAEHDHGACLDALAESIDFERLIFTPLTGALRAGGFGAVQEVGVVHVADIDADYLLYKANVPDASAPGGWGHEWVCVLIAPPSEPRRSQGYPSYGTLLAAVGHDIDVAVKLQEAGPQGAVT